MLARENSILLTNPDAEHADYNYAAAPELHLYQMTKGTHSQRVVDNKGNVLGEITVDVNGGNLTVDTPVLSAQPKLFVHVGTEVKEFDLKDSKETVSL